MAGLPSGSDPTQFDVGAFGQAGAGLASLADLTQDVVQEFYNNLVKTNTTLQTFSDLLFSGLNPDFGLAYAIISGIIERLFPFLDLPDEMPDLMAIIPSVPILGDLVELLTGKEDGDLNDLGTMFLNFRALLSGIDLLSGTFDPQAAWSNIATALLDPLGFFAKVVDLAAFANGIADALNSVPLIGPILGGIVNTVWGVISALIGQSTNHSNDIAVLQQEVFTPTGGGAVGWVDEFDGPQVFTLDLSKYTRTAHGSGGGHIFGIKGDGRSFWEIGSGYQAIVYTRNDVCTGEAQYASVVMSQTIVDADVPKTYLVIRSDDTGANSVRVNINHFNIQLEVNTGGFGSGMGAGTVTTLALWPEKYNPGDKIEIFSGAGADNRKYLVKRNGAILPGMNWVAEPSALSVTTNVKTGIAQMNGSNYFGFSIGAPQLTTIAGGDAV